MKRRLKPQRRLKPLGERAEADDQLTISVRGDDGSMRALLNHIRDVAHTGHSFDVVVDPDDADTRKSFGIDGDEAFRMEISPSAG